MVNKKLKRFEEKHALFLVFVLLAVLVLGSLLVIKPKMTGFAVIEGYNQSECVGAGYVWEDIINDTCTDIIGCVECVAGCESDCCVYEVIGQECSNLNYTTQADCENATYVWEDIINDTCTDIIGCVECVAGCESDCCVYEVIGGQCTGDVCDLEHLDLCDETECVDVGYWYNDLCNAEEECTDTCTSLNYECGTQTVCGVSTECGTCDSGYSCVSGNCEQDANDDDGFCGDGECPAGEDCTSCPEDCGECPILDESQGGITGAVTETICSPNWECGVWTACVEETQTRECTDTNACGTNSGKPAVSQSCVMPETCFDGMMNQDEKGIDCGGVCEQRCSFFTIMGNAVNVPINSSKEFIQNNKAVSFSLLGVIVLAVSWIVCVKVFLKKKNIFFFMNNLHLPKDFNFFKRKKKSEL